MTTAALFGYLFFLVGLAAVTIRRVPARHLLLLAILIVIYWGRMITMFAGDDDLDFFMLFPSVYSLDRIFDPSQYYVEFRPMMHFHNYMLWSLFGRSYYVGFKVVTLLFHLTNTLLAYRFLSLFLSSKGAVLAAAAIYAVHPAPAWEMMQIAPNYMLTFLFFISFRRTWRQLFFREITYSFS